MAGKLEHSLQILADKCADQRALNMKCKGVRIVDLVSAERSLVATLRILNWRRAVSALRVPVHHLDRHVSVARVNQQSDTVSLVNFPFCIWLFQRSQPPRSDELITDTFSSNLIRHCCARCCRHG